MVEELYTVGEDSTDPMGGGPSLSLGCLITVRKSQWYGGPGEDRFQESSSENDSIP